MPKPIKKRIAKQTQTSQDEVLDFLGRMRETAVTRQRQVTTAVAALAGIIIIAVVIYWYQTGAVRKAHRLEAQGYEAYKGLYEYAGLPEQERVQKALELFSQAYEAKKTPFALLYMANSQYELGDYTAVADTADRLVKEFPREKEFVPVALMKKAAALLASGQKEEALAIFNMLSEREKAPLADAALFESATLLEGMGNKEEATSKYENLVRIYPDSPYTAQALQKLGLSPNVEEGKEAAGEESSATSVTVTPSEQGAK